MESKEAVRERMRRYRMKKKGDVPSPVVERDPVEVINPVLLKMVDDLRQRVEVLEEKVGSALLPPRSVGTAPRQPVRAVSSHSVGGGVDPDLFKRVLAEKEARLKG